MRSNLMGTEAKAVLSPEKRVSPTAIALDRSTGTVYFSDKYRRSLESVSYDGTGRKDLIESSPVTGISYFENQLYWVLNHEDIRSVQTNIPRPMYSLISFSTDIKLAEGFDLTLIHRDLQPEGMTFL